MDAEQDSPDSGMDDAADAGMPPEHDLETEGYAPETVNLVRTLPDAEQTKIAARVHKDFERDWDSSERYREKRANILKMFLGMLPPSKNGELRSEIHYPIVATAVIRIHARVYDQQFPSNGEFFGVAPTDATDLERVVRVAKHMNWQIQHKIPEYVPNHDILIMQWALYGSAFSYTYWSPTRARPCHEACATEDIILPYKRRSSDPSLADVPRITRILRLPRHELEEQADAGYYMNVDKVYDKIDGGQSSMNDDMGKSSSVQEVTDKASGVREPDTQEEGGPRVLLEQHRWLKLPTDKRERPVIVTIDRDTKILLSVRLREDEDPEDRARYNREKAANEASYQAAMAQFEMDMAAYMAGQPAPSMTQPPTPGAPTMTAPPMPGASDGTMPGQAPPAPPEPPPEPAQPKMVPIHFFTHYVCIPNPEGIYGYGIGFLLEGHNMVADTIASQMLDAGTLSNTVTGVYSRQAKLGRGEFRIRPGEMVQSDLSPQDVDKGLHIIKFPPPEPALGQFIKDQKEEAAELSGANEILSGEVGGSNETATTTQIRISQALASISILNKRYTRARTEEGRKIARLNSVYLDDDEYFTVVDPFKKEPPMEAHVARMDYLEDVDITVTADPRMASQPQRFQEALQAWNLVNSSPLFAQNPNLMMAVARNLFVAMDRPELVAALMTPPPPPSPGMMPAPPPGAAPAPAAQQQKPPSSGAPRPKPAPIGPSVPNAGPTPANGPQMGQGS